jgi:hypothetical protein
MKTSYNISRNDDFLTIDNHISNLKEELVLAGCQK